jgi:hypothetical protein
LGKLFVTTQSVGTKGKKKLKLLLKDLEQRYFAES